MTEVSTKGLLPQLTDVLHALTGSHALLLSTIQSVRVGHISAVAPAMEVIGEADAPSREIAAAWSDTSRHPAVAATDVADDVAPSPSPASAESVPSDVDSVAAVRRNDPTPREEREAQSVDPGGVESESRNYNFFDELDARLAGLDGAGSAGDC